MHGACAQIVIQQLVVLYNIGDYRCRCGELVVQKLTCSFADSLIVRLVAQGELSVGRRLWLVVENKADGGNAENGPSPLVGACLGVFAQQPLKICLSQPEGIQHS